MDIKDKVVLVTGASSNIGKATAELFSKKGAKVVLAARSVDEVKELASTMPDALTVAVDMTKPVEVQEMVQKTHTHFGRIDVLINNTGPELHAPSESADSTDFNRIMALNVYGPMVAMQTTIPMMKRQGSGAIVNISSGILQAARASAQRNADLRTAEYPFSLDTRTEARGQGISVSLVFPRESSQKIRKHPKSGKNSRVIQKIDLPEQDLSQTVAATIVDTVEKGIAVEFR